MVDLFKDASDWLQDRRDESFVQPIRYSRGASTVDINATIGRTMFEEQIDFGVVENWESRDYLVLVDELILSGSAVLPEKNDIISETVGLFVHRYQVLGPGGEPPFRFSDRYRKTYRIHSKLIDIDPFTPADLSGLIGWYDASDGSTVLDPSSNPAGDGDSVLFWKDLSGNANNAQAVLATERPLYELAAQNGLAAINFDESDALTIGDVSQFETDTFDIFIVGNRVSSDLQTLFSMQMQRESAGNQSGFRMFFDIFNKFVAETKTTTFEQISTLAQATGFKLYFAEMDIAGNKEVAVNGTVVDSQTMTGAAFDYDALPDTKKTIIGAAFDGFNGNITEGFGGLLGEIAIYDRILTGSERLLFETYSQNKWAW